jgi:hypothetical protein
MNQTIYNVLTGEARSVPQVQAEHMATNTRGEWSFKKPLPPGWDKEIPRYRASISLHPSAYARHRTEPPFVSSTDNGMWQYAERPVSAGEELEITVWPHASMVPLNESARRVLDYFTSHLKSRLPQTPWRNGRLRLEDGLSGAPPEQGTLRPNLPSAAVPQPIRVAR